MDRKIVFSKRASGKLEKLFDYLEFEWSLKVKKNSIKKLDRSLESIKKYPKSCPKTKFINGLHKCVITKHTTIYYKYDNITVNVVTLFDNRQIRTN